MLGFLLFGSVFVGTWTAAYHNYSGLLLSTTTTNCEKMLSTAPATAAPAAAELLGNATTTERTGPGTDDEDEDGHKEDDDEGTTTRTTTTKDSHEKRHGRGRGRGRVRMNDDDSDTDDDESFWRKCRRVLRVIKRLVKLTIVFSPVVALYPFYYWISIVHNNNNRRRKRRQQRQRQHLWLFLKNQNNIDGGGDGGGGKTSAVVVPDDAQKQQQQQIATLQFLDDDDHDGDGDKLPTTGGFVGWYYQLCLRCVEYSGAACIKIMQWAGSRPDMFGSDFCSVFSQLQDDTTPHSWHHTQQLLVDTYGPDWQTKIEIGPLLGSGCIAQVHKGYIQVGDDDDDEHEDNDESVVKNFYDRSSSVVDKVGDAIDGSKNIHRAQMRRRMKPVAIKVMHPNVEDDIDADLDILRISVRLLERLNVIENLKWLNLPGFIEEMAVMLKIQLDLRQEGLHLQQFNANFKDNETIVFPQLVEQYPPSKHVLIESFCEGVPVMEWIKHHKKDPNLLSKMCVDAIKAVCQMVFLDNFTHGDLHP